MLNRFLSLQFFSGLKRITSSNKYIPEIDGIRFIAILLVVLFHISIYVASKQSSVYSDQTVKLSIESFLFSGHLGVEIFFVLSGFILSIPFATHYLDSQNSKKPSIKKFYLRRLSRLEPPYIITMFLLMIALFLMHKYAGWVLIKSFIASLTYTHNFIHPGVVPFINGVAWSLEVEFQFYMIAPFLCYIFKLNKIFRRCILLAVILTFIFLQVIIAPVTVSLFLYIQYFSLGFLIADLYLTKDYLIIRDAISMPLGSLALLLIMLSPKEKSLNEVQLIEFKVFLISCLFVFFYVAIFSPFWKKILGLPIIATIGGMCYTIYLIHFPIINLVGGVLVKKFAYSTSFLLPFLFITVILLMSILVLSTLFYSKIERPFMKLDWYKPILKRFNIHSN